MLKQILLYEFAKELAKQLEEDEEEYEQEYDDNIEFVTMDNDDEDDGSALLEEYNDKLDEFTTKQSHK